MSKSEKEAQEVLSKVEKIEKKIADLKAKKEAELKKENAKKAADARRLAAQKRKLESHLKIVIGGYVLATKNTALLTAMMSSNLRDNDRKALTDLIKILGEPEKKETKNDL